MEACPNDIGGSLGLVQSSETEISVLRIIWLIKQMLVLTFPHFSGHFYVLNYVAYSISIGALYPSHFKMREFKA
ncbi:MAG: hypothetical protein Tsb005_15530 [Gammaproteobacteria bacterium]